MAKAIATIEGKNLVVRIPLQEPTKSASGRNMVIATTNGSQPTDLEYEGKTVTLGLNAFFKP